MRRGTLIIGLVGLALVISFTSWILLPFQKINQLEQRYQTVQREMSEADVHAIMGGPGKAKLEPGRAWWDDEYLGDETSKEVEKEVLYSVSTFFLPVGFGFTFDENGRLIGRHRYD